MLDLSHNVQEQLGTAGEGMRDQSPEDAGEICAKQMYASAPEVAYPELADMADAFLKLETCAEQQQAFRLLMEQSSVDELLGELAYRMHSGDRCMPARVACALSELDTFRAKKEQVHTIGTFHYRLRNGGIENVLSILAQIWKDMKYEVVVFTDEEPSPEDYPLPEGVRRVVLPTVESGAREACYQRVKIFREELERNQVDIMVYHAWLNPELVADELCIKSVGIPLVVHTHGLFAANFSSGDPGVVQSDMLLSRCFRLAECVVALTEVDEAWWKAMGNRVCRIVNPLRRRVEDTPTASLDSNTVLWVGRLSEEKQPQDAIKIIDLVHRQVPDVHLKFIGSGEKGSGVEEKLKKLVHTLQLDDVVSFEGYHTEIDAYYQQADVVLSTSQFEGFGMVFVESKAFGLPMVTYELPNLDVVRHPRGLYVVPQQDYAKAAQCLVKLLTDDTLRHQMGSEARASAEEIYRMDMGGCWQQIFDLALTPVSAGASLQERSPLETAIGIAVDKLVKGIDAQRIHASVVADAQQAAAYTASLNEIRNSTAYRVGLAVTWLPRKLKSFLRRG